jgi:hypothetical protein
MLSYPRNTVLINNTVKAWNLTFSKFMFFKFLITDVLTQLQSEKAVELRLDTTGSILLVIWRHCVNCCASSVMFCATAVQWTWKEKYVLQLMAIFECVFITMYRYLCIIVNDIWLLVFINVIVRTHLLTFIKICTKVSSH